MSGMLAQRTLMCTLTCSIIDVQSEALVQFTLMCSTIDVQSEVLVQFTLMRSIIDVQSEAAQFMANGVAGKDERSAIDSMI
eukprot:69259-Pelagomonas_calceolata.AAC.1